MPSRKIPQQSLFSAVTTADISRTARSRFLDQVSRSTPWQEIIELVEPIYPKPGNGRQPYPMEQMIRIWLVKQWYQLSFQEVTELAADSLSIRYFLRLDVTHCRPAGASTIQRFDKSLSEHSLDSRITALVTSALGQYDLKPGRMFEPALERRTGKSEI